MTSECPREQDVLDALASQRWPNKCAGDLQGHLSECAVCGDLASVAAALLEDRETAWVDARVPPAGVVWWHAQLRAREDAARAAGRPVAFIQGVAASVAVWLLVSLYRAVPAGYLSQLRNSLANVLPSMTMTMADVARVTTAIPLVIFILVALWLVVAPVAIYFAAVDE
jgi:hypothetical protein